MDETAYFDYIDRCSPELYSLARSVLGHSPDNETVDFIVTGVIQDVWIRLFRGHTITSDNILHYLRRAVVSRCRNYIRDAHPDVSLDDIVYNDDGDDTAADIVDVILPTYQPPVDLIQDVRDALSTLTEQERAIVQCLWIDGLSYAKAGKEIGIPYIRIWRQAPQLLQKLRDKLAIYKGNIG